MRSPAVAIDRFRLPIWLCTVALLVVRLVRSHNAEAFGIDFSQVHDAMLNLVHHGDPYLPQPHHLGFVYPPSSALAFLPLGELPQTWSVDVGFIATAVAIAAIASGSARIAGWRTFSAQTGITLSIILVSGPGRAALANVNMSAVVAALMIYSLVLLRHERNFWSGLLFAAGLCLKPLIAPAILIFLFYRRLSGFSVAITVTVGLNLAVIPWLTHPGSFVTITIPALLRGQTLGPEYNSALSVVAGQNDIPSAIALITRVATIAAGAYICYRIARRPDKDQMAAAAGALVLCVAVVGKTDEGHYMLVGVPAIVMMLTSAHNVDRLIGIATMLLLGLPASVFFEGWIGSGYTSLGQLCLISGIAAICSRQSLNNTSAPAEVDLLVLSAPGKRNSRDPDTGP